MTQEIGCRRKLLIIDDEVDILELLKVRFEAVGYDVSIAMSGRSGIDIAMAKQPDVIILDIMMPGMDGFEVLKRLKDGASPVNNIPVIILSCSAEEKKSEKICRKIGAVDYMVKPCDAIKLIDRIDKIVDHQDCV
ncbi:MAG: response regulator [Deltaproteobacteria bacterium]|jgi:DNA-binding response OmpR family regulator|nr:response regulator [Deltaproteobacteria bacterium]